MARIKIDVDRKIGNINPNIYGGFVEHLGRCIYGGMYEENSPLSDERGFRKDVLEAVKALSRCEEYLADRYYSRGRAAIEEENDKDAAIRYLQQALEHYPDHRLSQEVLEEIQSSP